MPDQDYLVMVFKNSDVSEADWDKLTDFKWDEIIRLNPVRMKQVRDLIDAEDKKEAAIEEPWEMRFAQPFDEPDFPDLLQEVLKRGGKMPEKLSVRYMFITGLFDKTLKREVLLSDFATVLSHFTPEERKAVADFIKEHRAKYTKQLGDEYYRDLAKLVGCL